MPIYEYECRECGARFERVQRFNDAPASECPNGHHNVHRVLSAPAVIFNAPGFYVTDNRKGKPSVTEPGGGTGSPSPGK